MVDTHEVSDPEYQENPVHRCFICKSALFETLWQVARREGLAAVVEGSNADDLADHRPGLRAARQLKVRAPLLEAGLTKAEVRELARARGIAVWDRPSMACLASRIPYGSPITPKRLARIGRAEEAIRALGFSQVRVRDHGAVARIEVEPDQVPRLVQPGVRQAVAAELRRVGFCYVAVDLDGYRTGAMNEVLSGRPVQEK